jgi:hypothetical protein
VDLQVTKDRILGCELQILDANQKIVSRFPFDVFGEAKSEYVINRASGFALAVVKN